MNYGQYKFQYGADGRYPERQDVSAGQAVTPHLGSHPASSNLMSQDFPFHSTPMQPNMSSARFTWQPDISQSPLPPLLELLPILPAHRMAPSTQMSNDVLDLTVCRPLSVPGRQLSVPSRQSSVSSCLEGPIDMTVSSRASDQADTPLALTNKNQCDQATVMDSPRNHPKNLKKLKKSPREDESGGFVSLSKAAAQVSDAAALEVSPRRVTRQSVRSGQSSLTPPTATSAAVTNLSPSRTMEAVEGLLMLPQLTNPEASQLEVNPTARLLRIPRKGLRPMRLLAEHSTVVSERSAVVSERSAVVSKSSAVVSTPLESSSRTSTSNLKDSFTCSANPASSSSEVRSAAKGTSVDIRDLQRGNSVVSTVVASTVAPLPTATAETSTTDSVVMQSASYLVTLHEATVQNLKRSGAKTNRRENIFTVTHESSHHVEDPEGNVVPQSPGDTGQFSSSVVGTDFMHSYAGSMLSDDSSVRDTDSIDTICVPLDSTSAHDAGSMRIETSSILTDNDPIPADTVCMPSDVHSVSADAVRGHLDASSTPDAGTLPIETSSLLTTDNDAIPTDTEPMPPDTDFLPTDTDLIPSDADPTPFATDSMPTDTDSMPIDTDPMASDTLRMPSDADSVSTETYSLPTDTNSVSESTTTVQLNQQIASLASLDLSQTKQLILSLYRHLETLERSQLVGDTTDHSSSSIQATESHDIEHDTSHDLPATPASNTPCQSVGDSAERGSGSVEAAESPDTEQRRRLDTSHDLPATVASKSPCQEQEMERGTSDLNVPDVNSDTVMTDDDDENREREKSYISFVECEGTALLTNTKDSVDETVSSETLNTSRVDEVIPPGNDQLPVKVVRGVSPCDPMVMEPDEGMVEVPPGYFAAPFTTVGGELFHHHHHHHEQPVIVFVDSPHYLDSAALEDQCLGQIGSNTLSNQSVDEMPTYLPPSQQVTPMQPHLPPGQQVTTMEPHLITTQNVTMMEPHLITSQQVTPMQPHLLPSQQVTMEQVTTTEPHLPPGQHVTMMEPHLCTKQQVTMMEPHLCTNQQVTTMEPHLITSQTVSSAEPRFSATQNAALLTSHTCSSQYTLSLKHHSVTTQQVSLEPVANHFHQVSILEPVILTSQQVTMMQPHLHVLTGQPVSTMDLQPIASHQIVPETLSDHTAVPSDRAITTSQQRSQIGPHLMQPSFTSQVFPMEPEALSSEQVSSLEVQLTIQQVPLMDSELMTSQQVSPLKPQSTGQQVPLVEERLMACQQVSPLGPQFTIQQVSSLEPESITSEHVHPPEPEQDRLLELEQATSLEPGQVLLLEREQIPQPEPERVLLMEREQVPPPASEQVPLMESEQVPPPEQEQVPLLEPEQMPPPEPEHEPESMTSQQIALQERTTLIGEQYIPLSRSVPLVVEESSSWVICSSYQSSLQLEAISPPSSVRSTNDLEDAEEYSSANVFYRAEDLERSPRHPSVEFGSEVEELRVIDMENAAEDASAGIVEGSKEPESGTGTEVGEIEEQLQTDDAENAADNAGVDIFQSGKEPDRKVSHLSMAVVSDCETEVWLQVEANEASGPRLEKDGLTDDLERSRSPALSESFEDVLPDTVESGSELESEVVQFEADDLTEVVANEEVVTVDFDDDESLESLSLRLSVSSDDDGEDLSAKLRECVLAEEEKRHFEMFHSGFTKPRSKTKVDSTDAFGCETKTIERGSVCEEETSDRDECFRSDSAEICRHQIRDGIRSSNLIELYAEQLGTVVQVDPNHLPNDITSLFNCNVVVKTLNPTQSPNRERRKRGRPSNKERELRRALSKGASNLGDQQTGNLMDGSEDKKQRRTCAKGISYIDYDGKILRMASSEAKKMSKQSREKTGRKRSAGDAACAEPRFAEVESIYRTLAPSTGSDVTEPVQIGLIGQTIGSAQVVDNDPAVEPSPVVLADNLSQEDDYKEESGELADVSAVTRSQEDDYKEESDELTVAVNSSRVVGTISIDKPSEINLNCSWSDKESATADSFSPNRDRVPGLESPLTASSVLEHAVNVDVRDKSADAESDNRKVSKKICKISLSGLSKPPMLNTLNLFSPPTLSPGGDLDLHAKTSTSLVAFPGVPLNQPEVGAPIPDANRRREETGVGPPINDGKAERNIFQIKIPLVVDNFRASAEPDQSGNPGPVTHDIDRMVRGLRTVIQDVIQRGEGREGRVGETNQSEEGSFVTTALDSYQAKISRNGGGVADPDSEGFGAGAEEVRSTTEGKSFGESATPVETGETTGVCEAVSSSETTAGLSETPSGSSETLVYSSTKVNSVETVAASSETVVNSNDTPFSSVVKVNSSVQIVASGGPATTCEGSIVVRVEPFVGVSEPSERNDDTDEDDDNENTFFEPDEYPMEQDDASDVASDAKENPLGLSSLDENSPQGEQFGNRKRKFPTNPDSLYAVQIRSTKRSKLAELNCGQPCEIGLENETVFGGTDQSQLANTRGSSPRRNPALQQAGNSGIRTCGESIGTSPRNVIEPAVSERLLRNVEEDSTEIGFRRPNSQPDNPASTILEPLPCCLWEMLDTVETGLESTPGSPARHTDLTPHPENSPSVCCPESRPKAVHAPSSQLARGPSDSPSQPKSTDDLAFTSSSIPLLDSINRTTDMVIRKLPVNCSLIKCTSVNVLSRALTGATPGIKHLQCLFCCKLFQTMKGIAAHLEQCHSDVVSFASFRINPSKDFTICYFCRHCQFVTTDRVIMWIHFEAAHSVGGILQSCDDEGGTVADVYSGLPTDLDLPLDSPVHWYRAFVCPECNGLTYDEATIASHMSTTHPRTPCSNGHFAKVVALLRPRHHVGPLTYRMLLMDDAYSTNRKTCFVCLLCHFVVFDPRLALAHFLLLHVDMKLLLVCKSDSCNERFVKENSFVEHYQQRHKPKTIPTHLNCSVTLVTKSSEQETATEVKFADD